MRRLICALRGHGGIDANGFCKKCRSAVDCLPREWRKAARANASKQVNDAIERAKQQANSHGAGVSK